MCRQPRILPAFAMPTLGAGHSSSFPLPRKEFLGDA